MNLINKTFSSLQFKLLVALIFMQSLMLICNDALASKNSISINEASAEAITTAFNDFEVKGDNLERLSGDIVKVIANNLTGSGVFSSISKSAFIETKIGINHTPLFPAWQQINATLLVNGTLERIGFNKIRVTYILWDNLIQKSLLKETFTLPETLWRRAAHKISNSIYRKITNYEGYFDTKIVYVSETGPYLKRQKRLAIMDQDGANHEYLTDGKELVLTPRFSPDCKTILYLAYKNNNIPRVYVMDLKSRKTKLLGDFKGMSFAPRYSPDGKFALFSIAKEGNTHIYEINFNTKKVTQLTYGKTINTSPSYSPDGKLIVFNSDRYGLRQLFIMNRDGGNPRRISYSGGGYSEPSWSNADYISFTKSSRDHGFTIGVMRPWALPDVNTERLLANGFLVENPAWSNNGRIVIYARGMRPSKMAKTGLSRLYAIDVTGYNERLIPTPHDASDPFWSNNLD